MKRRKDDHDERERLALGEAVEPRELALAGRVGPVAVHDVHQVVVNHPLRDAAALAWKREPLFTAKTLRRRSAGKTSTHGERTASAFAPFSESRLELEHHQNA